MQKSIRIGFTLTPTEKSALMKLAELEGGLSLAALIRRLIRKKAKEKGIWKDSVQSTSTCIKKGVLYENP